MCCAVLCCAVLLQGYAYVEFMEADAVDNAIMLDNQELRGRPIKVGVGACRTVLNGRQANGRNLMVLAD
jgi:hypothetical protein